MTQDEEEDPALLTLMAWATRKTHVHVVAWKERVMMHRFHDALSVVSSVWTRVLTQSSISEYHIVKDLTQILIQPKNFAIKTSVAEFSEMTQHAQHSSRLSQRSPPLMELCSTPLYPPLKTAPHRRQ
ncbi:hypothetical protein M422DRAFT_241457 [Sphaerobolus stellatus SS14]|nr:hypothetical protein M422DRAFT_241457 [Sphaerobolus stellatus SS14]